MGCSRDRSGSAIPCRDANRRSRCTCWLPVRLAAPGYCSACIGGAYAVAPGRALAVAIRLLPARHTSRHSSLQARAFYWRPAKGLSYSYNLFPSKGGVHIHQIALELAARIFCPGTGSVSIDTGSLSFFLQGPLGKDRGHCSWAGVSAALWH